MTLTQDVTDFVQKVLNSLSQVIVGKEDSLLWILASILAGGHILIEDMPGVGKTTAALAFSKVLDLQYNRIQFTPDILPSDIIGFSMPNKDGAMEYIKGSIFCNLLLADELNRASSRTQSALLEAMEESQITVDGMTHILERPFIVIATQNPTGSAGTQLLPDSQMDRFMLRLNLGYPSPKDEASMILNRQGSNPLDNLQPLLTRRQLIAAQAQVSQTYVGRSIVDYLVTMIFATRNHPDILRGASPRAALSCISLAKAIARIHGRDYVIPADIREVFSIALAHRITMRPSAEAEGRHPQEILSQILLQSATPVA